MRPPLEITAGALVAGLLATITITATPGIESAAVLGVVLPPIVAGANAHRVARERLAGLHVADRSLAVALVRAALTGCVVVGVAIARLALEIACAEPSGLGWVALGPIPGILLAALVGELVGRRIRSPRLAATLAVLVPVGALGIVAWEIVTTPAVYVFTLFGGHWPGPIYDESRTLPTAFLTYRFVSLLGFVALASFLRFGPGRGRLPRFAGLFVGSVCALAFGILTFRGADLGHRTSIARIDEALGGRIVGDRCSVHLPSEMPSRERRRLLAECEAHVVDVERILHVRRARRLEAFVYRSADEKAELIGAGDTYVAKPWRGEVHVQRESFPHRVLRHEIVHVIAAERGPWPFRTSGALGGALVNPGLVEGLAVAVAWEERDDLTPDEWSLAMLELDQLPRAHDLFGAGFLGRGASSSYAAAGSFLAHLLRTRGPEAVGRMYLRGSVGDRATIDREERAWHAWLREDLGRSSERALALVRVRLLDRGLFSTRCGRLRARLLDELGEASQRFDYGRAMRRCDDLLAIDRDDAIARTTHAAILARAGRIREAERELEAMPETEVPGALRARLHTIVGDALVRRHGDFAGARRHYLAALAIPQGDDTARALDVRLFALEKDDLERNAILAAVLEPTRDSPSESEIGARLALSASTAWNSVPAYLLARRLFNDERLDEAEAYLQRTFMYGDAPTERIGRGIGEIRLRTLYGRALEGHEGSVHQILLWVDETGLPPGEWEPFARYLVARRATRTQPR